MRERDGMPASLGLVAERISTSSNWTASDLTIQVDVQLFEGTVCFVTDTTGHVTRFLIPLGMGVDYSMTQTIGLAGTFFPNFTDAGRRYGAPQRCI